MFDDLMSCFHLDKMSLLRLYCRLFDEDQSGSLEFEEYMLAIRFHQDNERDESHG